MIKKINLSSLLLQLLFTGALLYVLYIFIGPVRFLEVEMINTFFYLFYIPFLLISTTVLGCFIIGLPLRIITKLNKWWLSKQIIPFIGIVFCLLFFTLREQTDFESVPFKIDISKGTNTPISGGILEKALWVFIAFCSLHFYPKYFYKNIKTFISKKE